MQEVSVSGKSNITILGQTAPGDGIGIQGAEVSFFGSSNDIVRYNKSYLGFVSGVFFSFSTSCSEPASSSKSFTTSLIA